MTPKGWWRRNLVSLVSLLPLLVLVMAAGFIDPFHRFWEDHRLVAIGVNAEGFSTVQGVQMRLVELTEIVPKDSLGKPVPLPTGVTAWKAVVEYKLPEPKVMAGCHVFLEDTQGRQYGAAPRELSRVKGVNSFGLCSPEEDDSTHYRTGVYFVLAPGAKPASVRIEQFAWSPQFARLPSRG